MNPLPFFPPPARAFSQTGRGGPQSNGSVENRFGVPLSRRQTSVGSTQDRPKSSGTAQQASSSSLRKTFSQHGAKVLRDRGASESAGSQTPASSSGSQTHTPREESPMRPEGRRNPSFSAQSPGRSATSLMRSPSSVQHQPGGSSLANSVTMSKSSPSSSSSNSPEPEVLQSSPTETRKSNKPSPSQPTFVDSYMDRSPGGSSLALNKKTRSATLPVPSGRTGGNLPKGLAFEWVRPDEVTQCHALEQLAYDAEDVASRDRMAYRQKAAPHLFLGAYIPSNTPKVAGPLSVGFSSTPRKLIGYVNGTASCNFSARSLSHHAVANEDTGEEAWLVCLHSIVVAEEYRRKGLGLRLLEEYMTRLRRAEEGRGDSKRGDLEKPKGYEQVAVLSHEETMRFFRKAGFKQHAFSHVRVGSGNWVEMRRPVKSQIHRDDKEEVRPAEKVDGATAVEETSAQSEARSHRSLAPINIPSSRNTSPHPPHQPTRDPSPHSASAKQLDSDGGLPSSLGGESLRGGGSSVGGASSLGNFTQADLLAALSASSKSYAPGQNPSMAFSSVLGQTLAGKTFVEDAFVALEARLVDKRKGTIDEVEDGGPGANLAEIWCPREECGCKIIAKGVATWELAETGPLIDADLAMASLPNGAGALPPTPVPPPAPASHIRALKERERERARKPEKKSKEEGQGPSGIRSTLPGAPPSGEVSTPIRPFWSLLSPMSFDNIGFTKDVVWTVPEQSHSQPSQPEQRHLVHYHPRRGSQHHSVAGGGASSDESTLGGRGSGTLSRKSSGGAPTSGLTSLTISAPLGSDGSPHVMPAGDGLGESKPSRGKPIRRSTFFTSRKEKEREKEREKEKEKERERERSAAAQHANAAAMGGSVSSEASPILSTSLSRGDGTNAASSVSSTVPMSPVPITPHSASNQHSFSSPPPTSGQRPEADSSTTTDGSSASQRRLTIKYLLCPQCDTGPLGYTIVPQSLTGNQMGHATGGDKEQKEIQVFLVAAERVRYRFVK